MATARGGALEAEDYASFLGQSWTSHSEASMTTPRFGCAAVAVDGHIIALGAQDDDNEISSSVERSAVQHSKDNSSTLTLSRWSALPNTIIERERFGAAVVPPNFGLSADSDGAKPNILVAGGYTSICASSASAEAEMLDLSTNQWRKLPPMQMKRGNCAVTYGSGEGCVYVVGGEDGSKSLGSVECLSFSAQDGGARGPSWTLLASHMKHPRCGCAAVVVEGRPVNPTGRTAPHQLVVMGGYTDKDGETNSVEAYDFETGQWEELAPMKEKRNGCAAVAVGQCVCVVGGYSGGDELATAEYFDFRTRQWTPLPRLSKRRFGCAAVVVDGHMVVLGGKDDGWNDLKCVESLRIAVDDKHRIELPALPPTTNADGAPNRMQPPVQWCGTVEKLLAKVEADSVERMEAFERTKQHTVKEAEKECSAKVEALKSSTNGRVRETRHGLKEVQDEIRRCKQAVSGVPTPPRQFSVFIRDADGDRVPLVAPSDYASLKRLAAAELNLSHDVISKFRRTSDDAVVKGDRHMAILCRDDDLEVVMENNAALHG